ncbi:MAG TPA: hypothetical protein VFQ61_04120 [Polyangiaceae bacterium]|nr:hypothetical protein [Polyangiaceae bacterium]
MRSKHLFTLGASVLILANCGNSDPGGSGPGVSPNGGSSNPGVVPASGGMASSFGGQFTGGAFAGGQGTNVGGSGGLSSTTNAAGGVISAGAPSSGGSNNGTSGSAGAASGGRGEPGGNAGRANSAGNAGRGSEGGSAGSGGTPAGASGAAGSANSGTCVASKSVNTNASGSGPHKVVVETNSDAGINEGTIFRPADLGGAEKYPIFVWGEGGCSRNGLSNSAAMAEIASHGYFVIADGTPNASNSRSMDGANPAAMGKPLLGYVTWAIAENDKACSAYYQSLDTTKVAANGFSCGGLMAEGTAGDPRITTWGINSSGLFGANQSFYKTIHTPVLIVLGGPDDIAYENGLRDFDNISALGIPTLLFSKALGHGGDLFSRNGGDFTKIDLAWLNWHLKGDEGATGKGLLVGSGCPYCSDSAWEMKSKNIQ